MPSTTPPRIGPGLALALILAAGAPFSLGQTGSGDPRAGIAAPAQMDQPEPSGRDFAGLRIPSSVQQGDVALSGNKVWTWTENDAFARPGAERVGTQRLFLRGDVKVQIGVYQFSAAQASVWVQQLSSAPGATEPGGALPGAQPMYQIAIYFDRVSDPGAQAGFAQAADRLLVTGVLRGSISDIRLRLDSQTRSRPVEPFLRESEQRFARHLAQLPAAAGAKPQPQPPGPAPGAAPARPGPIVPGVSRPFEPGSPISPQGVGVQEERAGLPPAERPPPIFASSGILTVSPGRSFNIVRTEQSHTIIAPEGLTITYVETASGRSFQASAERGVVFVEPGPASEGRELDSSKVQGVYLEGDVVVHATGPSGEYNLRGPRMYYDVKNNRATIIGAVFWTYDQKTNLPLYVRAKEIRQESANTWTADHPTLATTSFFEPNLSLGAGSVTITKVNPSGPSPGRTLVNAEDLTMRAASVPFFYLPFFSGDIEEVPLTSLELRTSSTSGAAIKTTWDALTLLGLEHTEKFAASVMIDGYFDRGPGLGTLLRWRSGSSGGDLLAYMLIGDDGIDKLSSGATIQHHDQTRGILLGEHKWTIDEQWALFLEGAYVSDETFVDAFYRRLGQDRGEFTNSAYLRFLDDNSMFSARVKGSLNDFTPNQYLLQSPGYNTDKLPEFYYARLNDDPLPGLAPNLLSWSSEYRLSRMQLNFTEPTARELGFDTATRAREAFGINPDQSIGDRLRARGLSESAVDRADTRQELSAPLAFGPVNVTPFVVGRITAYDKTFEQISPDFDQNVRLFGAAGARAATSIQHVDDSTDSRFFDIHRIRHIVEPSVTVWTAGANLSASDLPLYDDRVEALNTGSAVRAGLTQTWQTQRGGPGRWHSVDLFRLSLDIVESSSDADRRSPIGRFYDWRPEYSLLGNFSTVDAAWQVSDSLAVSFNTIYDFDTGQPARTSAGGVIQHTEDFSTFAEARYINARDVTLVDFGGNLRLTKKYTLTGGLTYDTDLNEIQGISTTIRRRFPEAIVGLSINYNNISGETNFGFVIEPVDDTGRQAELRRRLGQDRGGIARGE